MPRVDIGVRMALLKMSKMKVLIVKTSALGDIIHALPVLACLKTLHDELDIDWVVESRFEELLRNHPLISGIIVVDTKKWRKNFFSFACWVDFFKVMRALRKQQYDVVFDLQGNLKSGLITFFTQSSMKVGLAPQYMQERINRLFVDVVGSGCSSKHISDIYIHTVQSFYDHTCQPNLISGIYTSPEDDAAATALLGTFSSFPTVCIHHGTTWETKFWHDDGWIYVARQILSEYPSASIILSSGTQDEFRHANELAQLIGSQRVIVLPVVSLKQFVAVLKQVTLVLGGDTGPVHLAAAVGTATVSLYRSSDGDRSGPRGEKHVCIQSPLSCTRCFKTKCPDTVTCMHSILPEKVFGAAANLIHGLKINGAMCSEG